MVASISVSVLLLFAVAGCRSGDSSPKSQTAAPVSPPAYDAELTNAVVPARAQESMATSVYHLDETEPGMRPALPGVPQREREQIHITLKSTPGGAVAAVDGVSMGRTPAFWEGEAAGTPKEFTFVLPGYAMARYRFVPTTSGVVHGTLEKHRTELTETDAGVAEVPHN